MRFFLEFRPSLFRTAAEPTCSIVRPSIPNVEALIGAWVVQIILLKQEAEELQVFV